MARMRLLRAMAMVLTIGSGSPTPAPSAVPTEPDSVPPTGMPTPFPTQAPTPSPSAEPTPAPSHLPTATHSPTITTRYQICEYWDQQADRLSTDQCYVAGTSCDPITDATVICSGEDLADPDLAAAMRVADAEAPACDLR